MTCAAATSRSSTSPHAMQRWTRSPSVFGARAPQAGHSWLLRRASTRTTSPPTSSSFGRQDAGELRPALFKDRTVEARFLGDAGTGMLDGSSSGASHVLNAKVFDREHRVLAHELPGDGVVMSPPHSGNLLVCARQRADGAPPTSRATLAPRYCSLRTSQPSPDRPAGPRAVDLLPGGQCGEVQHSEVDPRYVSGPLVAAHRVGEGNRDAQPPAAGARAADTDLTELGVGGQWPVRAEFHCADALESRPGRCDRPPKLREHRCRTARR